MADREEYKNKLDEIKELIDSGEKDEAIAELDDMNFKKIHNVNTLLEASSIYEDAGKYDDAMDILLLAHERSPIGRLIIYRLALLSIKMGDLDEAKGYYDEFVEVAPHDNLKYEIRYKLARAKGANPKTLIDILEELKNREFIEKWAYELAKLYHETGDVNKCTDLCDEIILWFGDGPYVERALELKMLYKPLSKEQEEKYRDFQNKKDGLTEIRPEDATDKSQILKRPVTIPKIELPPEKYDTVNLQAEIKRNIDEIMQATEQRDVEENLDAIKDLTKEFPFLSTDDENEELKKAQEEKKIREDKRLDRSLRDNFQKYLVEEHDGQMSMLLPENGSNEDDEPIQGQITIQDILDNWNKTARAAEKAFAAADREKLENAKTDALAEANRIRDKLSDAAPKLEAGVSPSEVLKEEYLSKQTKETDSLNKDGELGSSHPLNAKAATSVNEIDVKTGNKDLSFTQGISIPKTLLGNEHVMGKVEAKEPSNINEKDLKPWNPPVISKEDLEVETESDDVNTREASKIVEDMNDMLKKQIEEIYRDDAIKQNVKPEKKSEDKLDAMLREVEKPEVKEDEEWEALSENSASSQSLESMPDTEMYDRAKKAAEKDSAKDIFAQIEERESLEEPASIIEKEEPDTSDDTGILADSVASIMEEEKEEAAAHLSAPEQIEERDLSETLDDEKEPEVFDASPTRDLAKGNEQFFNAISAENSDGLEDRIIYQTSRTIKNDAKEDPDYVSEDGLQDEISSEYSDLKLSDEEKEAFTYFTPISGMEEALAQVLYGARERLSNAKNSSSGNIIIQGGHGSGKTTLALAIVKVLRDEIGKPNNRVGKIDGEKLNEKDIQKLFSKIEGGCLIIEDAGKLERETAVTLSLLMDNDKSGIFVIMEDDRKGIEKVLSLDGYFSRKFTEKITIPVLTIDELVNFGEAYANDLGYSIDEMGVLALYDRINRILRLDHPTYLTEVKEIIDEAIDNAEHGGFFSRVAGKKYDEKGKDRKSVV